jgi:uncharacterized membrane protein YidH (DUF202 family)
MENDKHFARDNIYNGNKKEPYIKAIGYIVFGLFFAVVGVINFLKLKNWERTGDNFEMNTATALMYKIGGKWFILVFMLVFAIVLLRKGYMLYNRIKMQRKL